MNIPENFDRWMFDYLEGNLSHEESEELLNFIAENPSFEMDADAWRGTKVTANEIAYPNEHLLSKKRRYTGWYAWSTAAFLVLLIGTGAFFTMNGNSNYKAKYHARNNESILQIAFKNNKVAALRKAESSNNNAQITLFNEAQYSDFSNEKSNVNTAKKDRQNNSNLHNSVHPLYNELNSEGFNGGRGQLTKSKNINLKSLEQATNKLTQAENGATYKNNPALGGLAFDMQVKRGVKTSTRSSKLKKIYRKIERMVDYPVGLINLRDPELILPESNLMSFNPAFVGGMLKSRLEFNYRNQWYGNNQNSHISSINFDTYSHQMKGGVGLQLNSEVFGNSGFSNHAVSLFYSPKVSISKNVVFEPAIKLTMGTLIGDPQKIGSNSLYELQRGVGLKSPDLGSITGTSTLWYKDFGAGFVLNTKWFYVGFSADNLGGHFANVYSAEGQVAPLRSPIDYTAIVGSDWENERKTIALSPFVSYRNFGQNQEAWIGLNFRMNYFQIGGSYSSNKDYTIATGLKFNKFKLVYHFDNTQPIYATEQIASHNISIRFNGKLKNARFKK